MELAAGFAVASLANKGVKILTGKSIAQNCVGLAYSVRSFSGVFFWQESRNRHFDAMLLGRSKVLGLAQEDVEKLGGEKLKEMLKKAEDALNGVEGAERRDISR